jgi:hypothetical protein
MSKIASTSIRGDGGGGGVGIGIKLGLEELKGRLAGLIDDGGEGRLGRNDRGSRCGHFGPLLLHTAA